MAERKFDSKRTHKLVSRVVIATAIWLGLLGTIQLNNVFYGSFAFEKMGEHCSGQKDTDCEFYYIISRQALERSGWRNLGVAVVLPVVFFGGTRLYRYMFPVQETETKLDGS